MFLLNIAFKLRQQVLLYGPFFLIKIKLKERLKRGIINYILSLNFSFFVILFRTLIFSPFCCSLLTYFAIGF